jgi:hypothetical protein
VHLPTERFHPPESGLFFDIARHQSINVNETASRPFCVLTTADIASSLIEERHLMI